MAIYFCDTSAIIKRYVNERGTAWLTNITDRAAGNRVVVAGITGVEGVAALTRKQRSSELSITDAAAAIASFRYDFASEFQVVAIAPNLLAQAMTLRKSTLYAATTRCSWQPHWLRKHEGNGAACLRSCCSRQMPT